jgi:hypothetical protein
VARHHQRTWPGLKTLITAHATDCASDRLILEGSALRPEYVASLDLDEIAAIWLIADDALLQRRIYLACGFEQATARERAMVENFLARTQRDNQVTMDAVKRLGLPWFDVGEMASPGDLADAFLERLSDRPHI